MVDLHSHVLFEIDDGAQRIEESIEILKQAYDAGIRKMMVTPHFEIGQSVEDFIAMRDGRLIELKRVAREEGIDIELKAGAEVYITDELFNEDKLNLLLFEGSRVMLTEFKYHNLKPEVILDYVDTIKKQKIIVLIAHPERYSYLMNDARLLDALLERKVLFQVNAISLFEDSEEGEFARFLAKSNLASVIASDIHHAGSRRLKAVKKLGEAKVDYAMRALKEVPDKIFEGDLKV